MSASSITPLAETDGSPASRRVDALDALRGYAILTMALSGMVPWGKLPQWMYHAQLIAPQMKYDLSVPGLTWVDLVFPFFLFSMGAAIPLALARRLGNEQLNWKVLLSLAQRFALLVLFAIYVRHIAPTVISNPPTTPAFGFSLLGFLLLFPTLTRLPKSWPAKYRLSIRAVGWVGCVCLLLWLNYRPEATVTEWLATIVKRRDIIILVLANTVITGGVIWMLTRNWIAGRIGVMLVLLALRLSHTTDGWTQALWSYTPADWLYQFSFQQYLLVVIPGTIIGDLLLRRQRQPYSHQVQPATTSDLQMNEAVCDGSLLETRRAAVDGIRLPLLFTFMTLAIIATTVVGLQARATSLTVMVVLILMALLIAILFRTPQTRENQIKKDILQWGALWLLIGFAFEPFEGGIKKDSATISYYFVTSGLACIALVLFQCLLQGLSSGRWLRWLIESGQNPMIAYVAIRSFLRPVVELTQIDPLMKSWFGAPWAGVGWACMKVLLLAWLVSLLTRRRVYWRT